MSTPRTKPWEVSSGTSAAAASDGNQSNQSENATEVNTLNPGSGGVVPERPSSLTSGFNSTSQSSPYGSGVYGNSYGNGYGTGYGTGYGGYGGSGYGSSMYGMSSGMYGMGGGYGGYGGYNSMYGMGGFGGGGMYGQAGGMAGGLAEGSQATFQLIESIIGAVGGFAQMLEATYMATHSSFFTMVSLAEQFGNLKNALGSLLGIFALIKFVKKILFKLSGKTYDYGISAKEFSKFEKKQKRLEDNIKKSNGRSRISFKPLLLFLAASIGFPYLLNKFIRRLSEQQRLSQGAHTAGSTGLSMNPSDIQFAKALYEFNPENPDIEVQLNPNDLVAILSKLDPMGRESSWWKVRSRQGKIGYVPSNFLSIIERKPRHIEQTLEENSDLSKSKEASSRSKAMIHEFIS